MEFRIWIQSAGSWLSSMRTVFKDLSSNSNIQNVKCEAAAVANLRMDELKH